MVSELVARNTVWYARWHLANWMVHAALKVAPKGPARTLLVDYLNAYGREVLDAIKAAKP
jgi:hypothetical protein